MKIHNVKQGSEEWLKLRAGIPTASESDALLSPLFKARDGKGVLTYVATKVAEHWIGGPLPSYSGGVLEQGQIIEQEAVPWFELEYGVTLLRPGFITTDDGFVGCSPDGMLDEHCGLEIKCPMPHTHVGYLLAGKLPDDYATQVHVSMFVTGAKRWQFLSYCRRFPALVLTIERDEEIQEKIRAAFTDFRARFTTAVDQLTALDGPQAPQPKPITVTEPVSSPAVAVEIQQPVAYSVPELPLETLEKLQTIIGAHALDAVEWMRTQTPPWLTDGMGLQHLTEQRANRIIANPSGFIRSVQTRKAAK